MRRSRIHAAAAVYTEVIAAPPILLGSGSLRLPTSMAWSVRQFVIISSVAWQSPDLKSC